MQNGKLAIECDCVYYRRVIVPPLNEETMEVDERLRWLEARISSSLRPRGEEMRSLFSDDENRSGERQRELV